MAANNSRKRERSVSKSECILKRTKKVQIKNMNKDIVVASKVPFQPTPLPIFSAPSTLVPRREFILSPKKVQIENMNKDILVASKVPSQPTPSARFYPPSPRRIDAVSGVLYEDASSWTRAGGRLRALGSPTRDVQRNVEAAEFYLTTHERSPANHPGVAVSFNVKIGQASYMMCSNKKNEPIVFQSGEIPKKIDGSTSNLIFYQTNFSSQSGYKFESAMFSGCYWADDDRILSLKKYSGSVPEIFKFTITDPE